MRRLPRGWSLLAFLSIAGCLGAPNSSPGAASAAPTSVAAPVDARLDGDACRLASLAIVTEYNIVKGFVPPEFDILEENGKSILDVTVARCDQARLEGGPSDALGVGLVGVRLRSSPDAASADAIDYAVHLPASKAWSDVLASQGFSGNEAELILEATSGGPAAQRLVARSVSPSVAFRFDANATAPQGVVAHSVLAWRATPLGYLRVQLTEAGSGIGSGAGTLLSAPGSTVAQLAGSTTALGAAAWHTGALSVRSETRDGPG